MKVDFTDAEVTGLCRALKSASLIASPTGIRQLTDNDTPIGPLVSRVHMLGIEVKHSTGGHYEYFYTAYVRSLKGPVQVTQYVEHHDNGPVGMPLDGTSWLKQWWNALVPDSELSP